MSRSSRRKTLSHSEIENFLTELSLPKQVDESLPETSPVSVDEPFISCTELISPHGTGQVDDEVVWIRELCKLKFSGPAVQSMGHMKRLEFGRKILQSSNYRILPTRMLRPEMYDHPADSLAAKKKLLLSLSPMLTDNETQRKADIAACEEFTRCKSGKGKGRLANYEYTDLDTNQLMDHAEFEKRYLNFVKANKPKSYDLTSVSRFSPTVDPNVVMTNKIPDLLEVYNLETPSVYVKEVSIKKKSELIQFDAMGKENVVNIASSSSSSSNILPAAEAESLTKPVPLNSLVPKKVKENDRKRKSNNAFGGSERRVTLSPATARAMMLKAFEEDEPTVFPACPVFDYDLGSNSMVSPSRLLIKEFKSPDVFSNPTYIDNEESEEPPVPSHLAVKLFIDELPVETPAIPATTPSEETSAMDVEKNEELLVEVAVVEPAVEAPSGTVIIDLTTEPSDCMSSSSSSGPSEVVASDAAVKSSKTLRLEEDLDNFSKELDGILANEDNFSPSPRANDTVFKFPSVNENVPEVSPSEEITLDSVIDGSSSTVSALDSLDALLSTDEESQDDGDVAIGSDAPSLEFLASVAAHKPEEVIVATSETIIPVIVDLTNEPEVESKGEPLRPSSTVQMVEEEDCELIQVLEGSESTSIITTSSGSSTSAGIEPVRSSSSCGAMLLDRENAKSVLQEAYSRLSEGASDLETFEMIETLIVKAEVEGASSGAATPVGGVIDSALYAFCNNAAINVPPASTSAEPNYDDEEEYPYFKPVARKADIEATHADIDVPSDVAPIVNSDETVAMSSDEDAAVVSSDQALIEVVIPSSAASIPQVDIDDIYGAPLDYGLAQEKAYKQRLIRFEIARWKYQWELVSVKAANEAIVRAKSRHNV